MHPEPRRPARRHREALRFQPARLLLELARGTGAEWGPWIQHLCQFEAEVLRVDRVSFWSLDDSASRITCDAGYVASTREFEHGGSLLASEAPEYFAALHEARALDMADVMGDPRVRGLADYCVTRGVGAMLDIPVWAEGRLAGVLCHEHVGGPRHWRRAEQDFAVGVGQVVASALAARAHTLAEAAARRCAFLDTVSRAVVSSLDTREIARRALALVVPRLADLCVVWSLNRDGALECLGWKAADPRRGDAIARLERALAGPRPGPFATRVFRRRQTVVLPDIHQAVFEIYDVAPVERAVWDEIGLTTGMGAPLEVGGTTIGTMIFYAVGRHFDADDRALAEDIACRVAAALQNARMYGIAREAIRARDDFLALVGHELRTPLTALQLRADALLRRTQGSGDAEEARRTDAIARDVRRFSDVVEHVLEASTIRAEGVRLAYDTCNLTAIVQACVARAAERAERLGIAISVHTEPSLIGRFDRGRIERVVMGLLDNALKFGEKRPIEVVLRRDGDRAELTVRDHGTGIAPDHLPALFEPFERAVPKEHFGGMGMGLYVAKAVVEAHGGSIAASTAVGEGTTFVVRLPLAIDAAAASGPAA